MSLGYSLKLRDMNSRASGAKLGVRLGRACIANDVPASVVANALGVTRQTVYNWFSGRSEPSQMLVTAVERYISSLR